MKFVKYLFKHSLGFVILAAVMGTISGAANARLISAISENMSMPTAVPLFHFLAFIGAAGIAGVATQLVVITLSTRLAYKLRLDMCQEVILMPLKTQEDTGSNKLLASYTADIRSISNALLAIPAIFTNGAITLGCFVYLGYLSLNLLGLLIVFIVAMVVLYLIPERLGLKYMARNREEWDEMLTNYNAINQGAKELKLHANRRYTFYHDVTTPNLNRVRDASWKYRSVYAFLNNFTRLGFYLIVGFMLYWGFDLKVVIGFVVVVLYVQGPIDQLITAIPTFRNANISFMKIRKTGLFMLDKKKNERKQLQLLEETADPFRSLTLQGVTHKYYREKEEHFFSLGPIDLEIKAGETVFLVGGNGSGKTTLAKLLTGLYTPDEGTVQLNGKPVTQDDLEAYRQNFSAIFSDFFIFEQFVGLPQQGLDEKGLELLAKLELDHKVEIKDGKLSTTRLSTGQRKRLALLMAWLEDRDVYLFDEWAADQDPYFKEVFYRKLLPDLKTRGKTLIVISHDDRYFDLSDRILKLTDGQLDVTTPTHLQTRPQQ